MTILWFISWMLANTPPFHGFWAGFFVFALAFDFGIFVYDSDWDIF